MPKSLKLKTMALKPQNNRPVVAINDESATATLPRPSSADKHNGYISAKSKVNEGATFIVSLPVHEEE